MADAPPAAGPAPDPETPRGIGALRHPVLFLRGHPLAADALLATAVAALPALIWATGPAEVEGVAHRDPDAGLALAIAATSLPLVWRRRWPLAVLGITLGAAWIAATRHYPPSVVLAGELVALYTVAAHSDRRWSRLVLGGLALVIGPLMLLAPEPSGGGATGTDVAFVYLVYGAVWLVGDNLRTRRANVDALRERAERAERDREEDARRAVEDERARIAREMHDVVAHSMSVMVVQAGGARRVVERDPRRADEALGLIEETGRQALREMRRLLGVLRDGGEAAPDPAGDRLPQPSLDDLDDLREECGRAGLPVAVHRRGAPRPLPPGIDLAAYRIVQEALTNVRRHAGPAAASVTIGYGPEEIEIEVVDDGRGLSADAGDGPGHGLVGMRERAGLYGGRVHAGPRPGGGFAVRAVLPAVEA